MKHVKEIVHLRHRQDTICPLPWRGRSTAQSRSHSGLCPERVEWNYFIIMITDSCTIISLSRTHTSQAVHLPAIFFTFRFKQVIVHILVCILLVGLNGEGCKGTANCPLKHKTAVSTVSQGPIRQRKCCIGWCAC